MSESLADLRTLGRVTVGQVATLLNIMRQATYTECSYVEQRYSEQARRFAETTRLLEALGWLTRGPDRFALTATGEHVASVMDDSDELRRQLILGTITKPGGWGTACVEYLSNFQRIGDVVAYAPAGSATLSRTEVRDFLLATGAMSQNIDDRRFELTALGIEVYVWAAAAHRRVRAVDGAGDAESRAAIGRQAELAVLRYECERVGDAFARYVEHVADAWPGAPYDIKSVTVIDGSPRPRVIEVKAVSKVDYRFYWSQREVVVAGLMGSSYFLYLVPCDPVPLIDKLSIISDPHVAVLGAPDRWTIEADVLSCRLKRAQS